MSRYSKLNRLRPLLEPELPSDPTNNDNAPNARYQK